LADLGDKVPVHERARSESLVDEARRAVADESTPKERLQGLSSDLQQALQMVSTAAYQQGGNYNQQAGADRGGYREAYHSNPHRRQSSEDVVDAEFTER
jgi:molecular chaperone DnaK